MLLYGRSLLAPAASISLSGGGSGASHQARRVAGKVMRRRHRFECAHDAVAAAAVRYQSSSSGCGPASPPTTAAGASLSAGGGGTLTEGPISGPVEATRLSRRRSGSGLFSDSSFAEVSTQAREISARVPTSSASSGRSGNPSASRYEGGIETAAVVPADIAKASDAAAALLALTSSPVLRRAFASRFENSVLDIDSTGDEKGVVKAVTKSSIEKEATPLGQETVEALHFAMISVSSWLQSSICAAAATAASCSSSTSSKNRIDSAIVQCIELTVRSTDLDLPLTIPLYRSLANLIAQHSSSSCEQPAQIIEVANLLRIALYPNFDPPPASLFHDPCVSLIRRGLVREAIDLLDEMDCEFGIQGVDAVTGLEMLSALAEGMGLDGKSSRGTIVFGGSSNEHAGQRGMPEVEFDAVDATELVFRLRGPLLRQLDEVSTQLQEEMERGDDSSNVALEEAAVNAEFVDLLEKLSTDDDIESDDEAVADNDSHDKIIDEADVLKMLQDDNDDCGYNDDASSIANLADVESLRDAVNSLSENESIGAAARESRTASYADDDHDRRVPQGWHDKMAKEMVYVRGGPEWDLPDLIDQLTTYNEGREVLYTREYEEALIDGMMIEDDEAEHDDYDMLR